MQQSVREPDPPPLAGVVPGLLFAVLWHGGSTHRSSGIPNSWLDPVRQVESFLFTVSLVGVGFEVDLGWLRRLGGRPLALGMASWVLVAGMSYLGVIITR